MLAPICMCVLKAWGFGLDLLGAINNYAFRDDKVHSHPFTTFKLTSLLSCTRRDVGLLAMMATSSV